MSKISKTILILLFIFIIFLGTTLVQATEEESLESDIAPISEEEIYEDEAEADAAAQQVTSTLDTLSTSSVTKVSTVNSYDQANLQLNNILSIILISIGVLLILFAIAILIRLKQ